MSSLVDVYVKPNCEKSVKALEMVMQYGGVDRLFIVGNLEDKATKAFGDKMINDVDVDVVEYISEEEFGDKPLPIVEFEYSPLGYEELVEAYESEELDSYFT